MNTRELRRQTRISEIALMIKKAEDEGLIINWGLLRGMIIGKYGVSSRLAKEYLDAAKSKDYKGVNCT